MTEQPMPSLRKLLADLHAYRLKTMAPADLQVNIDQRALLERTADRSAFVQAGDVVEPFAGRIGGCMDGTFRIPIKLQLLPRPHIAQQHIDPRPVLAVVTARSFPQAEQLSVELQGPLKVSNSNSTITQIHSKSPKPVSSHTERLTFNDSREVKTIAFAFKSRFNQR